MKVLEQGHISDAALENYSLDHLAEPELEAVEEHILICPACQERLREVDDFIRAFRMANERLERPGATAIVNMGWFAPIKSSADSPHAVWFQQPAVWGGLALTLALVMVLSFTWRNEPATPQALNPTLVQLVARRGADGIASGPAGQLKLGLDLRGIGNDPLTVEVATLDGRVVWKDSLRLSAASADVSPGMSFTPGRYLVRVRAQADAALLREFGLEVTPRP